VTSACPPPDRTAGPHDPAAALSAPAPLDLGAALRPRPWHLLPCLLRRLRVLRPPPDWRDVESKHSNLDRIMTNLQGERSDRRAEEEEEEEEEEADISTSVGCLLFSITPPPEPPR